MSRPIPQPPRKKCNTNERRVKFAYQLAPGDRTLTEGTVKAVTMRHDTHCGKVVRVHYEDHPTKEFLLRETVQLDEDNHQYNVGE